MKPIVKLLTRASLLGLPFALLLAVFEMWTGWDRSVYAQKKAALDRAAAQVEVLVLGSSQTYYGVDPTSLAPRTFNLALPGQSLRYDAALLRGHLDRMPRLRTVLIPISYFTLEYELSLGVEARRACNYYYHFGIPHEAAAHQDEARNFFNFLLSGRQQLAGILREAVRGALGRKGTKDEGIELLDANGGLLPAREPAPGPEGLKRDAPAVMRMHRQGMNPWVIPRNVELLTSMAQALDKRGIRLALFTPPVSRAYDALIEPSQRTAWHATVDSLAKALRARYRDYSADARFTDADFRDSNHLNEAGRRKFTAILGADLVRPTVTGAPGNSAKAPSQRPGR